MKSYCLGFCFATDRYGNTYVALIRKMRPAWQAGHSNGIGGEIELDETPGLAMVREFREETGVETDQYAWLHFADMTFEGVVVHCFAGRMGWDKFQTLRTTTDEEVLQVRLESVWSFNPLPNLAWLVPMAEAYLNNPTMNRVTIVDARRFACGDCNE